MPETRNRPRLIPGAASGTVAATNGQSTGAADNLAAARRYAAAGWPVFPCQPGAKVPLTPNGFKNATTDPAIITAWWSRSPRANVAVATGAPGPDVLDVDTKNGLPGMALFRRALTAGLLRGASAIVRTPSGGLHVWFTGTDQRGGATGEGRALELKARGGYVLLPPSYVETTAYAGRYELMEQRETAGVVDFAAIRRLLDPPPTRPRTHGGKPGRGGVDKLAGWVARQSNGNRNAALFWASCRALEDGAGDLAQLVDAGLSAGLPEFEVRRTVESARHRIGGAA